jgi:hypothetical protein
MANWTVEKYQDRRGRLPLIEYLDTLQLKDRARVLRSFALLEDYGPALKMPHAGHVQGKLWELRIDGQPNSYQNSSSTLSKEKNEHTIGNHESFQNHLRSHRIRCLGNCLRRVVAKLADFYSSKQ